MAKTKQDWPENRIRYWRDRKQLSQEALGELAGMDQRKLSRIENRKRGLDTADLQKLAEALGVNPAQLLGEHLSQVAEPLIDVPLISWVNAGSLAETADPYPVGMAENFITVPSARTTLIALRVVGTSMNRSAPEGATIIVDYEDRALVAGQRYVIKSNGQATFKRFRASPNRFEPESTEPDHEIILPSNDVQIVGRVVMVVNKF